MTWRKRAGQAFTATMSGLLAYEIGKNVLYPETGPTVDQRAALTFGLPTDAIIERVEKEKRLRACKSKDDAVRILYGSVPYADIVKRKEKYGNVQWNDEVLDRIVKLEEPILEICAGDGQWAEALRSRGVDVVATDNFSAPSRQRLAKPIEGVNHEEALVSVSKHPDRTLLLVYPSRGPLCSQVLHNYGGQNLIYVGEGANGVNADANFFCELNNEWSLERVVELPTLPDSYEKAFFLKRLKREKYQSESPSASAVATTAPTAAAEACSTPTTSKPGEGPVA